MTFEDARFGDPRVGELLAEWDEELGRPPLGGVPVEEADFEPPRGAFVCAGDGAACGGVRELAPGVGELKRVYVRRSERRRGVGRALLAALEERAGGLGLGEVRLDTAAGDTAAFFRAAGYEPIADYNGNPHARHWLAKRL